MSDRITPYKAGGDIEKRIDEICMTARDVHVEMMNRNDAWMRIGEDVFWIHATPEKGLVIRWHENYSGAALAGKEQT